MGKVYKIDQENPNAEIVNLAASVLRDGGIVIFPTETVYGISASAGAVLGPQELFEIKRRDKNKAIPWLVEDIKALDVYGVDVPDYAYKLAEKYWPGPLTLIVQASDKVGEDFTAADGTIALRAPSSPLVQELLRATGSPLITSSANTHTLPAPSTFDEIEPRILAASSLALDGGATAIGSSSTVVSCIGPKPLVWRDSTISVQEIREVSFD